MSIRMVLKQVKRLHHVETGLKLLELLERSAMPVAGIFFLASVYFGWSFTPQLVGDLATDKFSYDSPGVNYYLRLQWKFFFFGMCAIGGFFVLRAVRIFSENWRNNLAQLITLVVLIIGASASVYLIGEHTYAAYFERKVTSKSMRDSPETIKPLRSRTQSPTVELVSPDGSGPHSTVESQAKSERHLQLLLETVKAFRDLNSYLLNWSILLLTGISAFLVRELKILPPK